MKIRRPGYSINWLAAFTYNGDHTAGADDYLAYNETVIYNNGDKSLWMPVVTLEDSQPEHDETFEVGFWWGGVWHGCVVTIDDDDLPEVTDVEISSRPVHGDTYRAGESIDVTLILDREVEVTGRPVMSLYVGDGDDANWRGADYRSGSGTRLLTFRYRVGVADRDTDGVSVSSARFDDDGNLTSGFGGAGQIVARGTDVPIDYTHDGIGDSAGHMVDGRPYVQRTRVTSSPPEGWDAYRANQVIEIALQFNVDVVTEGDVQAPFFIGLGGLNLAESLRQAEYLRGSGSDTLVFGYTVEPGDMEAEGVRIGAGYVGSEFNGTGTIKAKGTDVEWDPRYDAGGPLARHKVDTVPPAVSSIGFESRPGAGEAYGVGELISVRVRFDEDVRVSGVPQLELDVGGAERHASLFPGETDDTLVFQYEVQEGDTDTDGVGIGANRLRLNGGGIHDSAGNAAALSHDAVVVDPGQKVDTSPEA